MDLLLLLLLLQLRSGITTDMNEIKENETTGRNVT